MTIQHKEKENRGMFFITEGEEIVAELVYAKTGGNTAIIEHTAVDEDLQGNNIGYELVQQMVEHARSHNMKVTPVCVFAKAVFDKKPEYGDVLA